MDGAREQAMADSLSGIKTDIATMGTKLDLLIQRIDPMLLDHEQRLRTLEQRPEPPFAELAAKVAKHETRITSGERWRWLATGLVAGASAAGSSVITSLLLGG